jgi:hypothetical protein
MLKFEVFTAVRLMMFFRVLAVDLSVDANVSEKYTVSIFRAEGGDIMFLRNLGFHQRVYTAPKLRTTT